MISILKASRIARAENIVQPSESNNFTHDFLLPFARDAPDVIFDWISGPNSEVISSGIQPNI